jgi:hypothetical protein
MEALSSASAPLPHERLRGSGYGTVLVLILLSLGFQLAGADTAWAREVTLGLQGATLLAALHVSGARPGIIRAAALVVAASILATTGILIGSGELSTDATRGVGLLLVVLAPIAIMLGIARHYRAVGGITLTTMFGVLCLYLLAGMVFSFTYGVIAAIQNDPFFVQQPTADQADFLYFSVVTMTTTGYGDLTAASDTGRSFATLEALFGQIYLVTVVALIVGNLGRRRPADR